MDSETAIKLQLDLWTKTLLDQSGDAKHVETLSMAALAFAVTTLSGVVALFATRWGGDVGQKKLLASAVLIVGFFLWAVGLFGRRRLAICVDRVSQCRHEMSNIIGTEEKIPDTFVFEIKKNRKGKYWAESLFVETDLVLGFFIVVLSFLALTIFSLQEMR